MDCFVIMPFGEKTDPDGNAVNYDQVYKRLIAPAVKDCGLTPTRCDEIPGPGNLIDKMIKAIQAADVAIVDISFANPNVFYELGVRYALKPSVTILIKNQNYNPPFNITNQAAISYRVDENGVDETTRERIAQYLNVGRDDRKTDSPVFGILGHSVNDGAGPMRPNRPRSYTWRRDPSREVVLIGGQLKNVKDYDIWVNSENTHMQMARHYDRSISSTIRYLGAKRDNLGRVTEDTVYIDLEEVHDNELGRQNEVPETQCLTTTSGALEGSHNVQRIIHVASVKGHPDLGYKPVDPLENCVWNAMSAASALKLEPAPASILLPFFGTGVGKHPLHKIAQLFLGSAMSFLAQNEDTPLKKIGFITLTEADYRLCKPIFDKHPALERLPKPAPPTPESPGP